MVHGVTLVGLGAADCSATTGGGVRGSRRRPLSSAELSRLPLSSAGIRNLDHRGSCVEAQEESGSHGSNLGALDRLSHRWMTLDGRRARLLLSAKRPSNCAASKKSAIYSYDHAVAVGIQTGPCGKQRRVRNRYRKSRRRQHSERCCQQR